MLPSPLPAWRTHLHDSAVFENPQLASSLGEFPESGSEEAWNGKGVLRVCLGFRCPPLMDFQAPSNSISLCHCFLDLTVTPKFLLFLSI